MIVPDCTCAAKYMPFGACCRVQQERFRVWPDGTVQAATVGPAYDWMSDDFRSVMATDEEAARNSPEV